MGGLTRSWALATSSWKVLTDDPRLLAFPAIAGVVTLLASLAFVFPAIGVAVATGASARAAENLPAVALLFAFYLVTSFIALFFNVGLAAVVLRRFRGERVTIGEGFAIALRNVPLILGFAVLNAIVGTVLALLERRGAVGDVVRAVLGAAWSVATFLVVPVMVAEGINPFSAIKRSTELLRQTWGAQVVGNVGIGLVTLLAALPGVAIAALGVISGRLDLLIPLAAIGVIWIAVVAVTSAALGQIYRVAVYLFATTGEAPAPFDGSLIAGAFRPK
ncbi:MAG: hypothetical protein KatS3mg060_1471 [Dehalococcoidia bacterium]|jgi:hypothetical protein|nr:MAG: hypothetical protein KatS3mg060_1471 [Dehalococcoidia bacterium]